MSVIRETIIDTLIANGIDADEHPYTEYVDKVAEALTEREYDLTSAILQAADGRGYLAVAENIIEEVGMQRRPLPPVVEEAPAEVSEEDLPAQVVALAQSVQRLTNLVGALVSAAEARGITVARD